MLEVTFGKSLTPCYAQLPCVLSEDGKACPAVLTGWPRDSKERMYKISECQLHGGMGSSENGDGASLRTSIYE